MRRALVATALMAHAAGCGGAKGAAPPPDPKVHRFEKADDWAKVFDDPERDAWQKPADVVALMKIDAGSTVADLGAGTGYFEPFLSRAVGPSGHVLALDVEPDMVRYLRDRATRENLANVTPKLVRTDDPLLAKESVDRILVVDTWHHVPDRPLYAARLRDGLRAGGAIFVVDYTLEATKGPPKEHRLSPDVVRAELAAVGLKAELVPEELAEQYVVVGRK
ncbi:MAG: class I SAM-dependent methyltransferase [Polyangiales bacterium]